MAIGDAVNTDMKVVNMPNIRVVQRNKNGSTYFA